MEAAIATGVLAAYYCFEALDSAGQFGNNDWEVYHGHSLVDQMIIKPYLIMIITTNISA